MDIEILILHSSSSLVVIPDAGSYIERLLMIDKGGCVSGGLYFIGVQGEGEGVWEGEGGKDCV